MEYVIVIPIVIRENAVLRWEMYNMSVVRRMILRLSVKEKFKT